MFDLAPAVGLSPYKEIKKNGEFVLPGIRSYAWGF
jgi:hypothetical protein